MVRSMQDLCDNFNRRTWADVSSKLRFPMIGTTLVQSQESCSVSLCVNNTKVSASLLVDLFTSYRNQNFNFQFDSHLQDYSFHQQPNAKLPRDRLLAVYEPSSPGRRERDTDFDNSDSDSSSSGDSGSTLPDTRHPIDPLRNHRPRHAPSNANSHPEAIPRMQMIDEALLPVTLLDGTPYPIEQRLLDKVLNFSTAPHAPFVHPMRPYETLSYIIRQTDGTHAPV